jgi:ribosome biogenesis GTPase A
MIGSIKDEILNTEELAAELIGFLQEHQPGLLEEKYHVQPASDRYVMLSEIARSRNCIVRGNELDTLKAARMILDDFRNGRLGKITLEFPLDYA